MKILYQLEITKETGFTATDFPDRFEMLRGKGKTPLVFKPVAIDLQTIYARLQEAEEILKKTRSGMSDILTKVELKVDIDDYFDRHKQ